MTNPGFFILCRLVGQSLFTWTNNRSATTTGLCWRKIMYVNLQKCTLSIPKDGLVLMFRTHFSACHSESGRVEKWKSGREDCVNTRLFPLCPAVISRDSWQALRASTSHHLQHVLYTVYADLGILRAYHFNSTTQDIS